MRRPGSRRGQEALRGSQAEGEGLEACAGWAMRVVSQETRQRKADGYPWTRPCCDPVKVYWQVVRVWQHKTEFRAHVVNSIYLCSSESGHGERGGRKNREQGESSLICNMSGEIQHNDHFEDLHNYPV